MVEKMVMQTKDLSQEKIRMIGELFPNCLTEIKTDDTTKFAIDFDTLKQELSDAIVDGSQERYQFTWPNKSKSKTNANSPTTKTLRPCRKESVDFDNTKNIYIEGDNLEALKILRETYLGKIKMIYIDPPYNTGNDFIYEDDFKMTSSEYSKIDGEIDDDGNRLFVNTQSNGRFHTDWLNMMYSRLILAKDLLTDDGIIFISIDDHECSNLKKMCDEIFGESKFVADISWQKTYSPKNNSTGIPAEVEHILSYSKSHGWTPNRLPRTKEMNSLFSNPDNDHSEWMSDNAFAPGAISHQGMVYAVQSPFTGSLIYPTKGRCWCREQTVVFEEMSKWASYKLEELDDADMRASVCGIDTNSVRTGVKAIVLNESLDNAKNHASELLKKGPWPLFYFTKNGYGGVRRKTYLSNLDGRLVTNLWQYTDVGHNDEAKKELKSLFDSVSPFDTPKPTRLIEQMIKISTDKDSLILDFFSGSATTANAVMKINHEDGGERHFILIQMPEKCVSANYDNICEIGKERIRRAGKKLTENLIQTTLNSNIKKLDTGFRVFKIDSSNMNDIFYSPNEIKRQYIDDYIYNFKLDRSEEDILVQSMLELGIELSVSIEKITINQSTIFNVDNGYLIACFDSSLKEDTIIKIAQFENKPTYVLFQNSSLQTDSILSNIEQIFKTYSPQTNIRLI